MGIRKINNNDIEAITNIYNPYILSTTITFEENPVSVSEMQERINNVHKAGLPWLVFEKEGKIVGYAYASQWKARSAYRYTVEPSIYIAQDSIKQGIGIKLFSELLSVLKKQGIKNVVGSIALPNEPSVGLHERMGFKQVGEFLNIGLKFDRKISVGYWQLELND